MKPTWIRVALLGGAGIPPGGWTKRGMAVGRPLDTVEVVRSTGAVVEVVVGGGVVVGANTIEVGMLMVVSELVAVGTMDVCGSLVVEVVDGGRVSLAVVSVVELAAVSLVVESSSVVVAGAYVNGALVKVVVLVEEFIKLGVAVEGTVDTFDAPVVIDGNTELELSLSVVRVPVVSEMDVEDEVVAVVMMMDMFPVDVALAVVSVGSGTGTTEIPEEPVTVVNVNEAVDDDVLTDAVVDALTDAIVLALTDSVVVALTDAVAVEPSVREAVLKEVEDEAVLMGTVVVPFPVPDGAEVKVEEEMSLASVVAKLDAVVLGTGPP